jgi:hypothetical protein
MTRAGSFRRVTHEGQCIAQIRNLCRTPCRLHDAEYMWVWVKVRAALLLPYHANMPNSRVNWHTFVPRWLCPCGALRARSQRRSKVLTLSRFIVSLCQDEDEVLVANRYAVVRWFQTARDKIFGKRAPGHDMTVPVLRLDDGTPFFIHEGTRYVLHSWDVNGRVL